MRQRITYLHNSPEVIDPRRIRLETDKLEFPGLGPSAKEIRTTFSLGELPTDLSTSLEQLHELHIRWISANDYEATVPYTSRLSPGLHVFATPRKGQSSELLCRLLKKLFSPELKCEGLESSFSQIPILSERFSTSSAFQAYYPIFSTQHLVDYIKENLEPLLQPNFNPYNGLLSVNYLDFDFDTISHALIVNAYWARNPQGHARTAKIERRRGTDDTLEVGILSHEQPTDEGELSLGGFLAVIGDDTEPHQTLFSFPSRHHALPASSSPKSTLHFTTSLQTPTGLHPNLDLTFTTNPADASPPKPDCALHAYLTLPSALFIDRYQFTDPLFLRSKNLIHLHSLSGETDLEAPNWVLTRWGSAALFELSHPTSSPPASTSTSEKGQSWTVTIPLHSRYLTPANASHGSVPLPYPAVFWACTAEEGFKMSVNPFDRTNLGYDGLFGPRTMFYHVPPRMDASMEVGKYGGLVLEMPVPVLDTKWAGLVEWGTVVVVLGGFLVVAWRLWAPFLVEVRQFLGWDGKVEAKEKKSQ